MAAERHQTNVNVAPTRRPPLRVVEPGEPAIIEPVVAARRPVADVSAALAVAKANQFLWFLCGVLELLLFARVALRVMGANPAAAFVRFIYGITQPFAAPFLGMVPNAAGTQGATLEVPTLIAMAIYFVLFLLLTLFLRLLISRPTRP
jgi:uncharacterized protein YggT (Ycf19 family)